MIVKNNKESEDTWVGKVLAADEEYTLEASKLHKWMSDDKVIFDLSSGDLLIGDGVTYKDSGSAAVSYLLGVDVRPKDQAGRQIVRTAATIDGWHAQFHCLSFSSSVLGSLYNKDTNGDDLGFTTLKLYDAYDVEITDVNDEENAVKTVIDLMPDHDYEIVGGRLFQAGPPLTDVRLWIVGLPGILDVGFSNGGLNLKLIGNGGSVDFDGRASKYLPYNSGAGTNKLRIVLTHGAGVVHEIQLLLEIFKP